MDAEFRTAPKSRILRNIDDMGKFLAEYHGNSAYWLQVISSRFCGGCALFMIAMLPFFCYSVLVKAAHLNPGGQSAGTAAQAKGFQNLIYFIISEIKKQAFFPVCAKIFRCNFNCPSS